MVSKDETTFLQASLKASKPTFFSGDFGKWGTILKLCSRSFRALLSFSARLDFTRLFHRFKTEGWRGWCTEQNYQAQNHQPEAQNHQPEPKKHLKNIRADLSAAKASALNLDSQRPGHQLLPWTLAIEWCSQSRECIVLWPSKWP